MREREEGGWGRNQVGRLVFVSFFRSSLFLSFFHSFIVSFASLDADARLGFIPSFLVSSNRNSQSVRKSHFPPPFTDTHTEQTWVACTILGQFIRSLHLNPSPLSSLIGPDHFVVSRSAERVSPDPLSPTAAPPRLGSSTSRMLSRKRSTNSLVVGSLRLRSV